MLATTTISIIGIILLALTFAISVALLWRMVFFSKHTPALYVFIILVAALVPLHLAQVVIGLMIMTQHVGPRNSIHEATIDILRKCHVFLSIPTTSALHLFLGFRSLRLNCKCSRCCRLTRPIVLFCWVVIIFLCVAEPALSVYGEILGKQGLSREPLRNRVVATAMFTDTVCLALSFATCFSLLGQADRRRILSRGWQQSSCDEMKQVLLKGKRRCVLSFLLIFPIQFPRGFLLLFWPTPFIMDLLSTLSGPVHYLSLLISILRITPMSWSGIDRDIALDSVSGQDGDAGSPVRECPSNPDGLNTDDIIVIGFPLTPGHRFGMPNFRTDGQLA
ncbi:uncharacterized protein EI90DRAFT_3028808 [Cantharellus anzutake]|uniref:uncharacterized protein n=1 Tax=Cantharellus anzutake TaxID=1750568 RepID=UPI0019044402|nr:uncharacterized protein EI90DRAFT_3028808 [Cantharellus anzutake]KAF8344225.1 hypothetical protein EI90DRAFT_3028808 [Cantharellus anzutake]